MKKILMITLFIFSQASCRYLNEYLEDKKQAERDAVGEVEHAKLQFKKFSEHVCKKQHAEYEEYLSTSSILDEAKEHLINVKKPADQKNEMLIVAYKSFMMELDKGGKSKYCTMQVEPIPSRYKNEIIEAKAIFPDGTNRLIKVSNPAGEEIYRITGGVLDFPETAAK